ncbi:MAG: hypothetical protein Q8M99_05690 [Methylotenera sp.]|nr:hypothetical protein [Methylotenera sp.]
MKTAFVGVSHFTRLIACIFVVSCIVSCNTAEQYQQVTEIARLTSKGARLPRLVTLPNDEVLMSWVEPVGEGTALKFVRLKNGYVISQGEVARGANWFLNWADFPSVAPISKDFWLSHRLVKQEGGKAYDYDIVLALSNDAGLTWRDIGKPHHDGVAAEHGFAAIFPVNGNTANNDAGIVWLDGRDYIEKSHAEKSGNFQLRYTRIQADGSMEAEQILDTNTCTCCWPSVAVTTAGPVAAWRGRTDTEIRDNQVAVLRDEKWSSHQTLGHENWKIDGCPVNGPALSARGMQVAAAWFSAAGDQPKVLMAFSKDGGHTFSKTIEVDTANPLGRIGLIWQDDNTAVISWMTADSGGKDVNLALRTVTVDGTKGRVKRIAEIGSGRDVGVPQMAYTKQGMLLVWTKGESAHGIQSLIVPWTDLSKQNLSQKMSGILQTLYATKGAVFLASICRGTH